jgi:hypothetical protein
MRGVSGLKANAARVFILLGSLVLVSCGSYSSPSSTSNTTGAKLRAFITNPLSPGTVGTAPVVDVVDALKDKLAGAIGLSTFQPGLMVVFPNKRFTLVYSGGSNSGNNSITKIENATESVSGSALTLPGPAESIIVAPDNATGYAAVPTAKVNGQDQGVVEVLNLTSNTITATVPVPGARFLAVSPDGSRVLVFGNSRTFSGLAIITPSLIGTSQNPVFEFPTNAAFDHPVGGVFSSDGRTAFILNCGAECGGTAASVTPVDMNANAPGNPVPVDAVTVGMLSGATLYVAGSPSSCPPGATAPNCGALSVIDTGSMTVTNQNPIFITDGYHNHMEMGADRQLFIGARTCSAGCLSIFDTNPNGKVTLPSDTGDVTGIQPISTRHVVYVCENGELRIYDTTTDKPQANQIDIIGQAVDVKLVD